MGQRAEGFSAAAAIPHGRFRHAALLQRDFVVLIIISPSKCIYALLKEKKNETKQNLKKRVR